MILEIVIPYKFKKGWFNNPRNRIDEKKNIFNHLTNILKFNTTWLSSIIFVAVNGL